MTVPEITQEPMTSSGHCPYCGLQMVSAARHICTSPSAPQPNYTVSYTPPLY